MVNCKNSKKWCSGVGAHKTSTKSYLGLGKGV